MSVAPDALKNNGFIENAFIPDYPERRRFLKTAIFGLGAASAAALGVVLSSAAIGPSMRRTPKRWIRLGKMEDFIPGQVSTVNMSYDIQEGYHKTRVVKPVIISRRPDVNHMVVFNTTCTHLGCMVRWDEARKLYLCACHGGCFDEDGKVLAGPPPRPLDRYTFKVADGVLFAEVV